MGALEVWLQYMLPRVLAQPEEAFFVDLEIYHKELLPSVSQWRPGSSSARRLPTEGEIEDEIESCGCGRSREHTT